MLKAYKGISDFVLQKSLEKSKEYIELGNRTMPAPFPYYVNLKLI